MNYDKARQVDPDSDRPDAGKWRYTSSNRRTGTHATGACSPFQSCTACNGWGGHWKEESRTREPCEACSGKGAIDMGEHACPGHDTPEEANAHQTDYLLARRREGTMANQQQRCQAPGCEAWTQGFVEVGRASLFVLCDEHRTRDVVAELFGTVGEVWHS